MEPIQRTGENWESFLKKYRLKNISEDRGGWRIESASGGIYRVRSKTKLDEGGSMYFKMVCDCPALKTCRHIEAVENMLAAEAIAEGETEVLERTE